MPLKPGNLYVCEEGYAMVWSALRGDNVYVMAKISPGELFICVSEPQPLRDTFWSLVLSKDVIGFVPSDPGRWDGTSSRR
jgi:hypothetical protein